MVNIPPLASCTVTVKFTTATGWGVWEDPGVLARSARRIGWLAGACVLIALPLRSAGVALPGLTQAARGATGGQQAAAGGYAIGTLTLTLVDPRRTIRVRGGKTKPRTLVTYVRYPARGAAAGSETAEASPAAGPFPLVVFAHGFNVTPATYARLLASWARAGYVVAAPLFPLTNPHAPGGPDESDVVNQPGDVSFTIAISTSISGAVNTSIANAIIHSAAALIGTYHARRVGMKNAWGKCPSSSSSVGRICGGVRFKLTTLGQGKPAEL